MLSSSMRKFAAVLLVALLIGGCGLLATGCGANDTPRSRAAGYYVMVKMTGDVYNDLEGRYEYFIIQMKKNGEFYARGKFYGSSKPVELRGFYFERGDGTVDVYYMNQLLMIDENMQFKQGRLYYNFSDASGYWHMELVRLFR